jgi:hypothetical protein
MPFTPRNGRIHMGDVVGFGAMAAVGVILLLITMQERVRR